MPHWNQNLGGATINHKDIEILLDWLEWGYYEFIAKG